MELVNNLCGRVTTVFWVDVCVTQSAWVTSPNKCNNVAHVFYQLLDNDADGTPDDPMVLARMAENGYLLWVPAKEEEAEDEPHIPGVGWSQMTGLFEAAPNSSDVPSNRGADSADRSTWKAATGATSGATVKEILHLITTAASLVYPDKWAPQ
mmetsp:Transcript_50903/g.61259  ORF Transcript_50903/g.61259 Transcript_50903/m.61259 type:complete len:153 (+) Transcript_50903:207-665(+)